MIGTAFDLDRALHSFRIFNERGGKFRVAVTNACNLDCFFCHNEGMANPRRPGPGRRLPASLPAPQLGTDDLIRKTSAFCGLGGRQVNVTGGEPLAHPEIVRILGSIDRRGARVILNTNALLADRLLARPPIGNLDCIFASLHTTSDALFRRNLGGRPGSAAKVMENLVALKRHGYAVQINYSLGEYNKDEFDPVLDFAVAHGIDLKAIALVRPTDTPGFYGGAWIDPLWVSARLEARAARVVGEDEGFGGRTTTYAVGGSTVKVKNIARGRLETDFCGGCSQKARCGEGIYALRVGVDGLFKPCLLRHERYRPVRLDEPFEDQILAVIDDMIGDWSSARFLAGAPG